jgi:uncharacterized protein (TIGR00730 family)
MHQGTKLRSLCVFCGANVGNRPEYAAGAAELGQHLAQRGIRLVYGAGNVGLMGVLADAALAEGGEVIGVIPQMLVDRELAHRGITDLRIVGTMHERKALMAELSDAFLALPGGLGTFEELCEALTWTQLGIHAKPCGALNTGGYFNHLVHLLDQAVCEGFVRADDRRNLLVGDRPAELLDQLERRLPADRDSGPGAEAI